MENFQSDLGNERSRSQRVQFASEASTSQTEKALEEHEKLVQEKKKLMKYIVVTKSKTEKELGSLQKQLQAEKEQTSFLSERVDILSESQAEAENTSKHLREQLEASFGKVIHPFISFTYIPVSMMKKSIQQKYAQFVSARQCVLCYRRF